jgi:hypothetical protein
MNEHDQAIRDEEQGIPWPENPSAVYQLARLRRIEAKKIDLSIRHVLWLNSLPWPPVS